MNLSCITGREKTQKKMAHSVHQFSEETCESSQRIFSPMLLLVKVHFLRDESVIVNSIASFFLTVSIKKVLLTRCQEELNLD